MAACVVVSKSTAPVTKSSPTARPPSFLGEMQALHKAKATESPEAASPPRQKQQVSSPPGIPKGGIPMPGFGSPPGPAGSSLANQLKSKLEERRRTSQENSPTEPQSLVQDVQEAVKIANDNSKCRDFKACFVVLSLFA